MLTIGIIGAGRAGRARMRAIEAHPNCDLGGVVSSQADVTTGTLDEVLSDDRLDAVCVCSVNAAHVEQVRAALERGKHVACEYPLALSHEEAEALFELARAKERVLHVEHIELLSGTQRGIREAYEEMGCPRPVAGTYYSQANSEGWIASSAVGGFPSFSGVSRLHRLVDLFGSAKPVEASFAEGAEELRLLVELEFDDGGRCGLDYRRGRGLPRHEKWSVDVEGGVLETVPPLPTAPLFEQDLDYFVRRVEEGADPYVSDERILDVLKLAEAIRERAAVVPVELA